MLGEACVPRVRLLWRPGSVGSKIEILTDGGDGPAIDHRAISPGRVTANRSLRECERTCHGERGRQNDCLEFHDSIPFVARNRTKTGDDGCQ